VTLMCTGNRRSEFNNHDDGETMGLPWRNGSISTASWTGVKMAEVLADAGVNAQQARDDGYRFVTFWGTEDYHVSIPIAKALSAYEDVLLAFKMNGKILPRDHGYPIRVIVPGYVGARSVKWLDRIVVSKEEVHGMHQRGIAYKQLPPNFKSLQGVSKQTIEELPPIDHVPVTSAITVPEPGQSVYRGERLTMHGYAYSGNGTAIIRVDVSMDGGRSWTQAEITRANETQHIRSRKAWAWVQWNLDVTIPDTLKTQELTVLCKAIDDQYNQQPHSTSPIWNLRGILNTSWGRVVVHVVDKSQL